MTSIDKFFIKPEKIKEELKNTSTTQFELINLNLSSKEQSLLFSKTNQTQNYQKKLDFENSMYKGNNNYNNHQNYNKFKSNKDNFSRKAEFSFENSISKNANFSILSISKKEVISSNPKSIIDENKILSIFSSLKSSSSHQTFQIERISDLGNYLGFGNYNQFMYIYSHNEKTSIGPYSYNEIRNFYNQKYIDSSTLIRLLDIFKFKNKPPFEFITIKDLINDDISFSNIETNSYLVQLTQTFKTKQEQYKKKQDDINKLSSLEVFKKKNNEKDEIDFGNDNIKKEEVIKSQFEHIKIEEKKENLNTDSTVHVVKKGKKKKGVEVDLKLGFYSMTKEEENYLQHFTPK